MLVQKQCHPIDTVKAKMQVDARRVSFFEVISRTAKAEVLALGKMHAKAFFLSPWTDDEPCSQGIGGLYKGIGVAAVGSCPAACLYFGGELNNKSGGKALINHCILLHRRHWTRLIIASCRVRGEQRFPPGANGVARPRICCRFPGRFLCRGAELHIMGADRRHKGASSGKSFVHVLETIMLQSAREFFSWLASKSSAFFNVAHLCTLF